MSIDSTILLWIQENLRCSFLSAILVPYTLSGNIALVWIIFSALLLIFPKTRKAGILTAIALLSSWVLTEFCIKLIVNRPRPYSMISDLQILVKPPYGSSFPSGHTSIAFACAFTIFFYTNKRLGAIALVLAVIMGFSRLYVGVHYPTDVLAGTIIGLIVAVIIKLVSDKISKTQKENKNTNENRQQPENE